MLVVFVLGCLLQSCALKPTSEAPLRILNEQNLIDILVGSCIQSTRNCDPSQSIADVKKALSEGKVFRTIAPENVASDEMVIAVQGIGGGGPWQYVIDRTDKQELALIDDPHKRVVQLFSKYSNQRIAALVRSEAAGATATALLLGAEMGIPTLDGGITGRAVPEVQQSIPWINGIASVPTAIISPWGDEIVITRAVDEYRVEDIARAIAVASAGDAWISMTPMSGSQLAKGILPGNLSEAELYGRTVREAREKGRDPIAALIDVAGAFKLFEGNVMKSQERGDRGFNWVEAEFEGTGDFQGRSYKLFVKNENIVGWLDGELSAMAPDYIYNLDPTTGESTLGVGYGGYVVGERVTLIAVPAPAQWRTQKGIELIGPRHFGFDFDYMPIEQMQQKLKQ
ncbi:DUF917 domain-containing protein [Ningiella sp. W23]|uniref:DUF917 domain-containing protein n=1 Tax=Ningiella sp. W23 TaxID=3023715 RepID=UPI0037577A1F